MSCQTFEGIVHGAIPGRFADPTCMNEKYKSPRARGKSRASFRVKFRDENAFVQTFRLGELC